MQNVAYVADADGSGDPSKLSDLTNFIENDMRMEYNYQPVMLLTLLKCPNCTAPKALLKEQLWRYNQFSNKKYAEPLQEAIQATSVTENRNIVSVLEGGKVKLNLNEDDQDSKNKLIDICYEKIAEWDSKWTLTSDGLRVKISDNTGIFLLQVSEKGSKEILQNQYQYQLWKSDNNKRDRIYGEVKPGDVLLVYFTNNSVIHSKTVKMVYVVSSVSEDQVELNLMPVKQLAGVSLDTVRENRDAGTLSNKFNLVGQVGNITKISREDYLDMLVLDNKQRIKVSDEKFSLANSIVKKTMEEQGYDSLCKKIIGRAGNIVFMFCGNGLLVPQRIAG